MEKKSILNIKGTGFLINIDLALFIEADNPSNTFSFYDLVDFGTHYLLKYDPKRKNIASPEQGDAEIMKVWIPQMVHLNPHGIASKYGLKAGDLPGRDAELKCGNRLQKLRSSGMLPRIDICGRDYIIYWQLRQLVPQGNGLETIDLRKLPANTFSTGYAGLFDTEHMAVLGLEDYLGGIRGRGLCMLDIPHELVLDPIAVARERRISDPKWIDRYPLRESIRSTIFPLTALRLRDLINNHYRLKPTVQWTT